MPEFEQIMTDSWLYAIIPALFLVCLSLFTRIVTRNWFHPSSFFSLTWALLSSVPLLLAPEFPVSILGICWIFVSVLIFSCGGLIVTFALNPRVRVRRSQNKSSFLIYNDNFTIRFPMLSQITFFLTLIGIFYTILSLYNLGLGLSAFSSFNALARTAFTFSSQRYSGTASHPLYIQVFLIGVYAAPIWGGILFVAGTSRLHRNLALMSLLPTFLIFITQSTRSAILLGGGSWLSAYITINILKQRRPKVILFKNRSFFYSLIIFMSLIASYFVGDVIRTGEVPTLDRIIALISSHRTLSSLCGHVSVFSNWFNASVFRESKFYWGAFTFAGIYDFLGIHLRQPGLYEPLYSIEVSSNIYTIFRGLIMDFGVVGSLIFLFIAGFISTYSYYKVLQGSYFFVPMLIAFYMFTFSYGVSCFNYNSIFLSCVLLVSYVVTFYFLRGKRTCSI